MKKILLTGLLSIGLFGATNELLNTKNNSIIVDIGYKNPKIEYNPNVTKDWVEYDAMSRVVEKGYISKQRILSGKANCEIDVLGREGCPISEQDCNAKGEKDAGSSDKKSGTIYTSKVNEIQYKTCSLDGTLRLVIPDNKGFDYSEGSNSTSFNVWDNNWKVNGFSLARSAIKLSDGNWYVKESMEPGDSRACGYPSSFKTLPDANYKINKYSSICFAGSTNISNGCATDLEITIPAGLSLLGISDIESVAANDFGTGACNGDNTYNEEYSITSPKMDLPLVITRTGTGVLGSSQVQATNMCPTNVLVCPTNFVENPGNTNCKKDYSYYLYKCNSDLNTYNKAWKGPVINTGADCAGQCGANNCVCNSATPPAGNCIRDTYTCPTNENQLCVITTTDKSSVNNIVDGYIYDNGSSSVINKSLLIGKSCLGGKSNQAVTLKISIPDKKGFDYAEGSNSTDFNVWENTWKVQGFSLARTAIKLSDGNWYVKQSIESGDSRACGFSDKFKTLPDSSYKVLNYSSICYAGTTNIAKGCANDLEITLPTGLALIAISDIESVASNDFATSACNGDNTYNEQYNIFFPNSNVPTILTRTGLGVLGSKNVETIVDNGNPEDNVWNKSKDICETSLSYACKDNTYVYDPLLNECIKEMECEGITNSSGMCVVDAYYICENNYTYDKTDLRCEKFPNCDRGTYSLKNDVCEEDASSNMCSTGYKFVDNRYRCEKALNSTPPQCPGEGLTFNTTTKHCEGYADMYNWKQEGILSAGNWSYNSSAKELFQSINGSPTFFVSSASYPASILEGKFQVENDGDDDWAGIVFGWTATNNFYAFDWKKNNQDSSKRGLRLMKVNSTNGSFNSWGDPNTNSEHTLLASNYSYAGWTYNTWYNMKIQFTDGKIETFINDVKVLSFENSSLEIPLARLGFLNVSQSRVHYKDFKITTIPICPVGYDYDEITNLCYESVLNSDKDLKVQYQEPSCPSGAWDKTEKKCKTTPLCPDGGILDPNDDRCVTNVIASCPTDKNYVCQQGFYYNSNTNKCEKVPNCPSNSNFDYLTNKCENMPNCNTGYTFNYTSKKCEKELEIIKLTCNSDETFIDGTTIDKCRKLKTISYTDPINGGIDCPAGYKKEGNEGLILCYKQDNCLPGYYEGVNINYCERTLVCPTGYNIDNLNNVCYK